MEHLIHRGYLELSKEDVQSAEVSARVSENIVELPVGRVALFVVNDARVKQRRRIPVVLSSGATIEIGTTKLYDEPRD